TQIPIKGTDGSSVKRDENGHIVITQYHPEFLKAAADAAGGTFIDASATDKAARVKAALATLRTQARASMGGELKTPRYQLFLFPALLLLLLDTALGERRGRRRAAAAAQTTVTAGLALMLIGCASAARNQQAVRSYHR